jgi:predicted nicotinamide N-methyase
MPEPSVTLLQQCLRRTLPEAHIELTQLPGVPEIRLGLIAANFPTGPLDPDVMRAVIAEPAYWAFCWGSGLALARFLLDEPELVRNKHIVDLGSGSGIAAIAAALAGAASVTACDTDADARLATRTNARANQVEIEVCEALPESTDLILMADVLYDRTNLPLLGLAQTHAREVLVADSRISTLPDPDYREVDQITCLTFPNLGEFDEFNTACIWQWRAGQS